jgi:hypothetical protein
VEFFYCHRSATSAFIASKSSLQLGHNDTPEASMKRQFWRISSHIKHISNIVLSVILFSTSYETDNADYRPHGQGLEANP